MNSKRIWLALLSGFALSGLGACGSAAGQRASPPAQLERIGRSGAPSIVLSAEGLRRLGVQTATATAATKRSSAVVVPYAALLYEPDGRTILYTNPAPRTYTRQSVVVERIVGERVYLSHGPTAGTRVVTVGGEELLGVQNGVGAQT